MVGRVPRRFARPGLRVTDGRSAPTEIYMRGRRTMGWASGSSLMCDVIAAIRPRVLQEKARLEIYRELIDAFEEMDCDTLGECAGEDDVFDEALRAAGHDID